MILRMQEIFANANDVTELIETLKEYQEKGMKEVQCGMFASISIERLIHKIESLNIEQYSLEEIYRSIYIQLNY